MLLFKRTTLLIFLLLAFKQSTVAQLFHQTWLQTYGEDSAATGIRSECVAADNNSVYVAGMKDSAGFRSIMQLVKYDMTGNIVWTRYHINTNQQNEFYLTGMLLDSNGDIIIGATELSSFSTWEDYSIFKFDPSGNQLWNVTVNGVRNMTDWLQSIHVDNQNNIYATGSTMLDQNNNYQDVLTAKISPAGQLVWKKYSSYPNDSTVNNNVSDLKIDKAGNILLIGSFSDSLFCKMDSAGNVIRLTNFGGAYQFNYPIALDDSCNIYFPDETSNSYSITKTDSAQNILFSKNYYSNSWSWIYSIQTRGNNLYSTGKTAFGPSQCLTVKTDLNGDTAWTARFGAGNYDYYGRFVLPKSNGGVTVVCQLDSTNGRYMSMVFLNYSPSGQLLSQHILSSAINYPNIAISVADNNQEKVFCALGLYSGPANIYGVAAYDSSGHLNWSDIRSNYQNDGEDAGYKIIRRSSGDLIIAGESMSPNGSKNISVIAYNPSGVLLWKRRIQAQHPYSLPLYITSDNNENVYVSGYTADNTSSPREMLFAKLDANGNIKFIRTTPSSTSINYANSSFTDNYGNSFVSTSGNDTLGYFTSILLKYDSSGNLLWQKLLSDSAAFSGMVYDQHNSIYSYHTSVANPSTDIAIIKSDTSGNIQWRKNFNGPMSGTDSPVKCMLDAHGDLILVGSTDTTFGGSVLIQKYDPNGNVIWQTGLTTGITALSPVDFDLDVAGNIYIALNDGTYSLDYYFTAMLDSSGNTKWLQYFSGSGNFSLNKVSSLKFDGGSVFVTGRVNYLSDFYINLLVYDTTGSLIYQDTIKGNYQLDDMNCGNDIVADGNGCVYLTGLLDTYEQRQQIATIKYCSLTAGIINGENSIDVLNIFPNPNTGNFKLSYLSDVNANVIIDLYDVVGNKIFEQKSIAKSGNNILEFNNNDFKTGCYFVTITSGNNILRRTKFIKY